mmetsp:Transcript_16432/g.32645  ORF Transcript_16432/g.32645 Transcript_16432/m.32645 type:complete len:202 (-) Transcript_16432:102-707(-)
MAERRPVGPGVLFQRRLVRPDLRPEFREFREFWNERFPAGRRVRGREASARALVPLPGPRSGPRDLFLRGIQCIQGARPGFARVAAGPLLRRSVGRAGAQELRLAVGVPVEDVVGEGNGCASLGSVSLVVDKGGVYGLRFARDGSHLHRTRLRGIRERHVTTSVMRVDGRNVGSDLGPTGRLRGGNGGQDIVRRLDGRARE